MKKLIGLIECTVLVSATVALAGCGNGGSKFVGTWNCGGAAGDAIFANMTQVSIKHDTGNNYDVKFPVVPSVPVIYKDGELVDPNNPKTTLASIDKNTGDLILSGVNMPCKKNGG